MDTPTGGVMAGRSLIDTLKEKFSSEIVDSELFRGELTLVVRKDTIVEVIRYLRDELTFDMLKDLCGVDRFPDHPRFEVVYHLYSSKHKKGLRLKASLDEGEKICTIESIWKGANWYEREVFDLFGIVFENHSDLRRILLWDEFDGYPLRKDFPTEGRDFEKPTFPEG